MNGHIKSIVPVMSGAAGVLLGHFGLVGASVPTFIAVIIAAAIIVGGRWIFGKATTSTGWKPVVGVIVLTAVAVVAAFTLGGSLQFTLSALADVAFVVTLVVIGWWIMRDKTKAMNLKRKIVELMTDKPTAGDTDGTND